jgi:hypothetical protein
VMDNKRRKIINLEASAQQEDLPEPSSRIQLTMGSELLETSQDIVHDFLHSSWAEVSLPQITPSPPLPPPTLPSESSTCVTETSTVTEPSQDLGLEFAVFVEDEEESVKDKMYDNEEEDLILLEASSSPVPPPKPKYIPPPYVPIKRPRVLPQSFQ